MQNINLGPGCNSVGIVIHEIGHALGFWHEQSRPDRDRYVRVNFDNIKSKLEGNFMRRKDFHIDNQGSHYDYGSIMHYSETAFSKGGCRGSQCITLLVANASVGKGGQDVDKE